MVAIQMKLWLLYLSLLSLLHTEREKERGFTCLAPATTLRRKAPQHHYTLNTALCLFATSNRDAEASPLLLHESLNGVS